MMLRTIQRYLTILVMPMVIQCTSVLGPRTLRPHSTYRAVLAGGPSALTLDVAVEGRRATGEPYSQSREVQLRPGASRVLDLEIGDPGPGEYALRVRSTSGAFFEAAAPLVYQPRTFCVFIETDKRVYQPGDTIYFRIVGLDKYLLPLNGVADVTISDANGAPVRQWAGVQLDRGLLAAELKLADEPALGEWTVAVDIRGQSYSRKVMVADYVLPKFDMTIQMPKQVLFSEGQFVVNVTAKHFNGQPVHGELTLSAYAVFFSGILQPVFSSPARKVVEFHGRAEVVYNLKTDLDLAVDAARPLVVEAVLEEKDTLVRQNVSAKVLLMRTPYRLRVTAPECFKTNLMFPIQIETVDADGELMDLNGDVSVDVLWDDGTPENRTRVPLSGGRALYSLTPGRTQAASTLNVVIKYEDVTERLVNVIGAYSANGQHLTIELTSGGAAVGGTMRARVHATEPLDILHYAVFARGDVQHLKTLELSQSRRVVELSIPVLAGMAPGCVLMAWYPSLDNIMLASTLYVPVDKLLQHEVSLSVGGGVRPGSASELSVSGEPGAHVALLGEDVQVARAGLADENGLGSGLNLHMIEREVESFNGLKHSVFKNEDHQPALGVDLSGYSAADTFENAGVVILTDGNVTRRLAAGQSSQGSLPETGTRAPQAGPYAFSRLPPPVSPRYYLTVSPQPTWMITNFTLGNDGKGSVSRRTPMAAGEWSVGAFALHPAKGLGLAAPRTLTANTPLALTAELPAQLQRGETLAAVVTVTSALSTDTDVELTFHNTEQYFEFEPLDNEVDSVKKIELFRRLRVRVPAHGSNSTAFLVTAARRGEASIIVEAYGNGVSATLYRTIDVKEGYEEELWTWMLLDARRGAARGNVSLSPRAGTRVQAVSFEVAGDPLVPALQAARRAPAPSADPAHALRPLAVASVLLDYLDAMEYEVSVAEELRAAAAAGYQRLVAYWRSAGYFAADVDGKVGDVWMTALAVRWLTRSAKFVAVSPTVAKAAARWLADAQLPDGSWQPPPVQQRHNQQAQKILPLTAHALLALQRAQGGELLYKNAITRAVDFVARNMSAEEEPYALAVAAAALAAARHPEASRALQLLDKHPNITATSRWWGKPLSGMEWRNPWLQGNSADKATAGWGLRALLAARIIDDSIPVAQYLLSTYHPNDLDPDVLESLSELAEAIKSSTKLRVSVAFQDSEEPRTFSIDNDNAFIMQTLLVRSYRNVSSVTEGRGLALVGLSAVGRTNVTAPWPRYTLDPRIDNTSTAARLQLSICVGFVPQGNETISGFTLLTVQLPSGFVADINTLTEMKTADHVSFARLSDGGTRVLAWLRPLSARERCATLAAPRVAPIANQKPGVATLVDLYDSSHHARVFFQPPQTHPCDICRSWPSCDRACGASNPQVSPDYAHKDTADVFVLAITLSLTILYRFL